MRYEKIDNRKNKKARKSFPCFIFIVMSSRHPEATMSQYQML